MNFAAPVWLYLLPIVVLGFTGLLWIGLRLRSRRLQRFASPRLLQSLTRENSPTQRIFQIGSILAAVAALTLALARPQYGVEWSERKARGLDIVFVLDSSRSMLATDLRPNRLERAKLAVIDLVDRLQNDRIGLVAFAGQAFLQTPLTLDYAAFREGLDAVDPQIMTSGGSDLGQALREAGEAFPRDNNVKVVVLLTDGEDLGGQAIAAAEEARDEGIQVFAVGIGTPQGDYLRVPNEEGIEEFVRDSQGQPVLSQLDEATLQQIAQMTRGNYARISPASLEQLYTQVLQTLPREERSSELEERPIERFQWAIALAIVCLVADSMIGRRRRRPALLGLILLGPLVAPDVASAQETASAEAGAETGAEEATTTPADAFNQGYEALMRGDFAAAARLYEETVRRSDDRDLQSDALYNMGHAFAQKARSRYGENDLEGALDAIVRAEELFNSTLEMNPGDASIEEDLARTRQVREPIEKLIKQREEEQQEQNQPGENAENEASEEASETDESEADEPEADESQPEDASTGEPSPPDSAQDDPASESAEQDSAPEDSGDTADGSEDAGESDSPNEDNAAEGEEASASQTGTDSENRPGEDGTDPSGNEQAPSPTPEAPPEGAQRGDSNDAGAPRPEAGEDSASATDPPDSSLPVPETADQTGADPTESGAALGTGTERSGMTEAEAAALLDSLRGRETLLPFTQRPRGANSRDTRDW